MKVLSICLLCLPLIAIAEEQTCQLELPPDYPEEMLISEDRYNQAAAWDSIKFLETTLPGFVESSKSIEEFRGNEIYFMSLPNNTKMLKGFILKQDYELAKVEHDLALANNAEDAEDKETMEWAARKAFCDFMSTVPTYVD